MKVIKNLSAKSRIFMYQAVNNSSDKGIMMAERKARRTLFDKISSGVEPDASGNLSFVNLEGKDLILQQSELDTLKRCLEGAVWPNMVVSLAAEQAEIAANEAEDYKEDPAKLTPETAAVVDEVMKPQ